VKKRFNKEKAQLIKPRDSGYPRETQTEKEREREREREREKRDWRKSDG